MNSIDALETRLRLRVVEGAHQQVNHPLTRSHIAIGRANTETPYSAAFLAFPEPTLSREHVILLWDSKSKGYVIHHRSQTNATLVNGRVLKQPATLKPGDTIGMGRLVLVLERLDPDEPNPLAAKIDNSPYLLISGGVPARTYSIPLSSHVKVHFGDEPHKTVASTPGEPQTVHLTAPLPNSLLLNFDPIQGDAKVEIANLSGAAEFHTKLPFGLLKVPLRPASIGLLNSRNTLDYQGYRLQLGAKDSHAPSGQSESEQQWAGVLQFLNGALAGAVVCVPQGGSYSFELGPKSRSFVGTLPLPNCPNCQWTVKNGLAYLRVLTLSESQFVDVNGDLFFSGETAVLASGSQILLGEHSLLWVQPGAQKIYSRFGLTESSGRIHPITKSEVRIGTSAHCEIRIESKSVAPIEGALMFQDNSFTYEHRNMARSAKIQDNVLSTGLQAPVTLGDSIELGSGVFLRLEKKDPEKTPC